MAQFFSSDWLTFILAKTKSNRRKNPYGEGTIYKYQSGRFTDKWIGQLIIGTYPKTGKPTRGESLKIVQELLGHAEISTTGNTYVHVMPEIKKQAAINLDHLLTRKNLSCEKLSAYNVKLHYTALH